MTAEFTIFGTPMPKGSKTAFVRGQRAVLVEGGSFANRKGMAAWADAVLVAAERVRKATGYVTLDEPLCLDVTFFMPRPKSAKRRSTPARRPDLDKLLRAVLDPITKSRLIFDDSRIVELVARKAYADDREPGALVRVWSL